ncbi:MAG: hypothetical protein WBA07_33700 [Rivularia sp. (in: cyanobacteria)]
MNKPIGYHAPYALGRGLVLEEMEKEWGSYFENISHDEKFWLLAQLSRHLWLDWGGEGKVRDGVITAATKLREQFPPEIQMGVIEALCDQLKPRG